MPIEQMWLHSVHTEVPGAEPNAIRAGAHAVQEMDTEEESKVLDDQV